MEKTTRSVTLRYGIWLQNFWITTIGSLSNDDGAVRTARKKNNSFILAKPNNFARASRFFIHFLTVVVRLNETNERLNLYGLGVYTSSRKIGTVRVKNFDLFLIR